MNFKYLSLGFALSALLALPATAQTLMAQNTYGGGTSTSQDSILAPDAYQAQNAEIAKYNEVLAAETNLNISAGFMHTQYHENFPVAGQGDDENGFTAGFGIGASALLPRLLIWPNIDLYSSVSYEFSAGNINYVGHYQNGVPLDTPDRAVFNRIEGRFGLGFPLVHGMEFIPFIAGGYQAWNRNIDVSGQAGTDEHYTATLLGGGLKLDVPVTNALVVSGTAEVLSMIANSFSVNGLGISHGLGGSAQERLMLGADYDVKGPFHVFASSCWEHFNYAGYKPSLSSIANIGGVYYYITEPLSTTTQFGINLGVAYSF